MNVQLFIPCLVDQFRPSIGRATALILDRAGLSVSYPEGQTCCGQPAYKTGRWTEARKLARHYIEIFSRPEPVVCPAPSCTSMVLHYPELLEDEPQWRDRAEELAGRTFELSQFLVDELGLTDLTARLTTRAAYHHSCQSSRGLGVVDQPIALLNQVRGLELVELELPERCCGFGGLFSLEYPELSTAITADKADDIIRSGAETVITNEPSCLMNIGSFLDKRGSSIRALHLAEVLAGIGEAQ